MVCMYHANSSRSLYEYFVGMIEFYFYELFTNVWFVTEYI